MFAFLLVSRRFQFPFPLPGSVCCIGFPSFSAINTPVGLYNPPTCWGVESWSARPDNSIQLCVLRKLRRTSGRFPQVATTESGRRGDDVVSKVWRWQQGAAVAGDEEEGEGSRQRIIFLQQRKGRVKVIHGSMAQQRIIDSIPNRDPDAVAS